MLKTKKDIELHFWRKKVLVSSLNKITINYVFPNSRDNNDNPLLLQGTKHMNRRDLPVSGTAL